MAGVLQRGPEPEHRSAVGVPTDRLTEAPGGCPASALLAWIVEYLFADIEIKQGASTDPLDSGIAWRVEHGALEQLT